MFLIDLNQVMFSTLLAGLQGHTNVPIEESMIRHMILNTLRSHRQRFKEEYGEPIIACDNVHYWRKQIFPQYKANRKKMQAESELNWNEVYSFFNKVRQELKEYFPYKVLDVDSAEADDIIGTLVHDYGVYEWERGEPILILSGDKDYIQLQEYINVKQYDPVRKRWIEHDDPEAYLFEHILKGDAIDGIPNVLSADDCLVAGVRQKPMTQKRISAYREGAPLKDTHYYRNERLIDLSKVPDGIKSEIRLQFLTENDKDRSKIMPYFVKYKLRNLLEHLSEF
jgi:5'-3' exonuclease